MKAEEISPGSDYAYVDPDYSNDPLRATVLDEPENGVVRITVHHPDVGDFEDHVATRTLHGPWVATPDLKRWKAVVDELRAAGEATGWEQVARTRTDAVRRQRALALRLRLAAGIVRMPLSYAGLGGQSDNRHDGLLQLNYDELERLLDHAENGPGYVPATGGPGPEQDADAEAAMGEARA